MFARTLSTAAAAVALSLAGAAHASVIYDNGPAQGGGLEVTQARVADDFHFAADTRVGGAGVFLGGAVAAWDGGFQYSIYDNIDGAPGTAIDGGPVSVTPVDTGVAGADHRNIFLYQFDFLTPFQALGGHTYFLAIHARSDFGDNNGIFWTFTEPNGSLPSQFQGNGTGPFSAINGFDNAFFLTSASVPEPATWGLMLAGFGLTGAALRRRRSLAAA